MSDTDHSLREALETVQQAAADLQRDMDRLAEIKATIRVNALRGGATTDEVEAMVRGEKSFVDFLAKLCDARAALAAAPQPAPEREALAKIVQDAMIRTGVRWDSSSSEAIADALLARGLRLPGGDATMGCKHCGEKQRLEYLECTECGKCGDVRVVEGGDE